MGRGATGCVDLVSRRWRGVDAAAAFAEGRSIAGTGTVDQQLGSLAGCSGKCGDQRCVAVRDEFLARLAAQGDAGRRKVVPGGSRIELRVDAAGSSPAGDAIQLSVYQHRQQLLRVQWRPSGYRYVGCIGVGGRCCQGASLAPHTQIDPGNSNRSML